MNEIIGEWINEWMSGGMQEIIKEGWEEGRHRIRIHEGRNEKKD